MANGKNPCNKCDGVARKIDSGKVLFKGCTKSSVQMSKCPARQAYRPTNGGSVQERGSPTPKRRSPKHKARSH